MARKVVILGASGRDFHNFNVYFRNNPEYRVVAFLQTQIEGLEPRLYPPELAGELYPNGIPILGVGYLDKLAVNPGFDEIVLAYSDLTFQELGEVLSKAMSTGASFRILGFKDTMLESIRPVIAVTGVKTGVGKSSVSREIALELRSRGLRVGVVRHPMPYSREFYAVQKFEKPEDLGKYPLTVEEREEYEHYIKLGFTVYAGVDYGVILRDAEKNSDVILWDGGNNDFPFYKPDYYITVVDAMRPGLETSAFPGMLNFMACDHVIINKADQADKKAIDDIKERVRKLNPKAEVSVAYSDVYISEGDLKGVRKVIVVEDAPTVTHGGASYAAGFVAARKYGLEVVDPREYARGSLKEVYEKYKHIGPIVPSLGYNPQQLKDLEETLNNAPADAILLATPSDITALVKLNKPVIRVSFKVRIVEGPGFKDIIDRFLERGWRKNIFTFS
ncbi:cyclic 2,3-diphosphoglycerate synthase [Thermogladius sp. 4427co]|uniref:cyclic 2,3-diphosphoglycerate synthase n=1 Tax=Thermogladius sp. 4427co TaxID=3450718 RepID=UPI003F7A3AA7